MALAWDPDTSQVVIEAQEVIDEEDLEAPEPAMLRVRISAGAARAFTQRALKVVAAGRPPCPLCAQPLDAEGHVCVRLNGYRGGERGFMTAPESEPVTRSAPPSAMDEEETLKLLRDGTLEVAGRLVEATNMTLYCSVKLGTRSAACVYKPVRGERPLWDFPDGTLAAREVAAFEVSQRPAGTSCRPRSTARARSAPACASSGSTPSVRST